MLLIFFSIVLFVSSVCQLATAWLRYNTSIEVCAYHSEREGSSNSYTWKDDDFPPSLPLDLGPPVALTLENTVHYPLSSDADAEWETIYPGSSNGFVRLGPDHRFFGVSMYHQIYCLDSLRWAIMGRQHDSRTFPTHSYSSSSSENYTTRATHSHVPHCLNYLRQTILCAADLTLEPELVLGSNDVGEGLGVTHVCKDWSIAHEFVKKNAAESEERQS